MKAWIAYFICAVVWGSTFFAIALGMAIIFVSVALVQFSGRRAPTEIA